MSDLVGNPEDRFSCVEIHMVMQHLNHWYDSADDKFNWEIMYFD